MHARTRARMHTLFVSGPKTNSNRRQTHTQLHKVPTAVTVKDDESEGVLPPALQTQVGALVPVQAWATRATAVVWVVKWGATGLVPVRPMVVMTSEAVILPGRALNM